MNIFKRVIRYYRKHKYEYLFAWGANIKGEMFEAIIGRKPELISKLILNDYELCIQTLQDVPTAEPNPRAILQRAWGENFKSYAIRKRQGKSVSGALYKITSYERKMVDAWELVPEGWFVSKVVSIQNSEGREFKAHTQVLPPSHDSGKAVDGINYEPWIVPKEQLLRIARTDSKRYPSYVY